MHEAVKAEAIPRCTFTLYFKVYIIDCHINTASAVNTIRYDFEGDRAVHGTGSVTTGLNSKIYDERLHLEMLGAVVH